MQKYATKKVKTFTYSTVMFPHITQTRICKVRILKEVSESTMTRVHSHVQVTIRIDSLPSIFTRIDP